MQKRLSPTEIEAIRKVRRDAPQLTRAEIAERFGVSARTIQRVWADGERRRSTPRRGAPRVPRGTEDYVPPTALGARWPF